ncbi:MAG: hypothetical protein ABMB14_21830 [Myxococcota bacterium]
MSERIWPIAIAAGLLFVIAVNGGMVYLAVNHAPIIEPSYTHAVVR